MPEERAQRRLAAILAADVVGYSCLMGLDEAGTLATLKARRKEVLEPLVARHRGRIFKVAGDGVLVEFGSAVDAVECAVELQRGMAEASAGFPEDRSIVLRIGVNLGDVMVEGGDLYGDGVNIAARLEALADPGGILVSGTAHDHVRNKVKVGFDDLGAQTLKNIATPVHAYRVTGTPAAVIAATVPAPDKPSIAILPFTNMSNDPEQQYFSDGITEDVITELSRFASLDVIARNSSFQYRDKSPDIRRVGRELGVDYVVEGSVRRIGGRLRITAQLIDASNGRHLWAERYDRSIEDLFDLQDEVVRAVVAALAHRVRDSEAQQSSRKSPRSWMAYDYLLQARQHIARYDDLAAEEPLRRAVELDPTLGEAYAHLAIVTIVRYWFDDDTSHLEEALQLARKSITINDRHSQSHVAMGFVCMFLDQHSLAGTHFERAVTLNPNDIDATGVQALWLTYNGRCDEALVSLDSMFRRDPFPPNWYWAVRGTTLYQFRRYHESIEAYSKMSEPYFWTRVQLMACYAQLGRMDKASEQLSLVMKSHPDLTISRMLKLEPYSHDGARNHFVEGMRKGGLPE